MPYKRTWTGPEKRARFRVTFLPMMAAVGVGIALMILYMLATDSQPGWLVPVTVISITLAALAIKYRAGTRD